MGQDSMYKEEREEDHPAQEHLDPHTTHSVEDHCDHPGERHRAQEHLLEEGPGYQMFHPKMLKHSIHEEQTD